MEPNARQVTESEGSEFAQRYGMRYLEVSALTGTSVREAYRLLLDGISQNLSFSPLASEMRQQEYTERTKLKTRNGHNHHSCFS